MRILVVVGLFCLSAVADFSTLEKECYERNQASACNALSAQFRALENFDKAFDAAKNSCELMDDFG
jgi:hypothetical protein